MALEAYYQLWYNMTQINNNLNFCVSLLPFALGVHQHCIDMFLASNESLIESMVENQYKKYYLV